MTWDGFSRLVYDRTSMALQRQANTLLVRGNVTVQEAALLVNTRNQLLLRIRAQSSPFAQLYAEILKNASSLKSLEKFLAEKGSIEAVLQGVGKTRTVVDKIGITGRVAGPAVIILQIGLTAVVIAETSPDARARVTAREVGGFAGMWAGCATGAALASPSLLLPIVGEISTGGACFVGGLIGGLGLGYAGQNLGHAVGEGGYDLVTKLSEFKWVR